MDEVGLLMGDTINIRAKQLIISDLKVIFHCKCIS